MRLGALHDVLRAHLADSKHGDIVKEDWCSTIALREEGLAKAFVLLASPPSSAVAVSEKVMGREAWCDFYCCWHRWMPIVPERDPRARAQAVFDFVQMHFAGGDPDPHDGGRPRLLSADGAGGFALPRRRAVVKPDSLDVYSFEALVMTLGDRDVVRSLRHARRADALEVAPGPLRQAAAAFLARPSSPTWPWTCCWARTWPCCRCGRSSCRRTACSTAGTSRRAGCCPSGPCSGPRRWASGCGPTEASHCSGWA
ncbi:unnamed protein product [Prorocentrum cordatum]|uniref:Uncharacterized protein n=1 Tax=Prorocentrum cordatum TaxID=2364126 RepID=A0ABN9T539_9DINO|nr:unnamed protein product [Polarella glacialis]